MPAYKDTERGTWYCTFYYTDWTGKKIKTKKRGFARKKDAEAYEREFLLQRTESPTMTFQSMYDLYMADMKNRLKENTYLNKEFLFKNQVLPYFGPQQLDKITPAMIRTWQNELLKKDYKATYIRTIHNQINALFNYAVKYYGLRENPCRKAGAVGKKRTDSEMLFWTVEEFNTAVAAVKRHDAKVALQVMFWTGIRIGELCALTGDDFDLDACKLRINKSFQLIKGEQVITVPKTERSVRTIDIPQTLADMVKEYIDSLYDYDPDQRLFMFTKSSLRKHVTQACKDTGVKQIRLHDLRHSHAALLISLGTEILLVSERLGHENVETTLNVYGHLYPSRREKTVQKLDELAKVVPK